MWSQRGLSTPRTDTALPAHSPPWLPSAPGQSPSPSVPNSRLHVVWPCPHPKPHLPTFLFSHLLSYFHTYHSHCWQFPQCTVTSFPSCLCMGRSRLLECPAHSPTSAPGQLFLALQVSATMPPPLGGPSLFPDQISDSSDSHSCGPLSHFPAALARLGRHSLFEDPLPLDCKWHEGRVYLPCSLLFFHHPSQLCFILGARYTRAE